MSKINQNCIKCGSNDANINFSPDNETIILNGNSYEVVKHIESSSIETMVMECRRCGYAWEEKPLDHGQVT